MAIGYGSGENRVEEAVSSVLDNPLLEDTSIKGATRALIYVAGGENLPLVEYDDVVQRITSDMDKDAIIIPGMYLDPSLDDTIRVTVIATGFTSADKNQKPETVNSSKSEMISDREFNSFIGSGFVTDFLPPRDKRDEYRFSNEDLDVPTVLRDRRSFVEK
jgi:cell division protein FtsZ